MDAGAFINDGFPTCVLPAALASREISRALDSHGWE
jgi:hypothetical protein